MKYGMSKVAEQWDKIKNQCGLDVQSIFNEMHGQYFSNGINIGREVGDKLKNGDQPWPTLLQFEGLDSGLSHGFLTSFGVCVISEGANEEIKFNEDLFNDFSLIVNSHYGYYVSFEKIDNLDELKTRYPDTEYHTYPDKQQWTMPGVLIHYSK